MNKKKFWAGMLCAFFAIIFLMVFMKFFELLVEAPPDAGAVESHDGIIFGLLGLFIGMFSSLLLSFYFAIKYIRL